MTARLGESEWEHRSRKLTRRFDMGCVSNSSNHADLGGWLDVSDSLGDGPVARVIVSCDGQ